MKKNALGFIALAVMFMGSSVLGESGAIRSIDPCNQYGVRRLPSALSIENGLRLGEKAYFRIRLENHNSSAIYQTRESTKLKNPWVPYVNDMPMDPKYAGLQVGVYVSGRPRFADVIYIGEPYTNEINELEGDIREPYAGAWFTDLVCEYTIQPGDIACPMLLANNASGVAEDSATTEYLLRSRMGWCELRSVTHEKIAEWSEIRETNILSFRYGNYNDPTWYNQDGPLNAGVCDAQGNKTIDYTLSNAHIFIKAIDFASRVQYDDNSNEVWRAVMEGDSKTRTSLEDSSSLPTELYVPGPLSTNGYVYLWIEDTNTVRFSSNYTRVDTNSTPLGSVPGNSVVPFHNTEALKFNYTTDNLEFELRGVTAGATTKLFLSSVLTTNLMTGGGRTITNYLWRTVACVKSNPTLSVTAGDKSEYDLQASSAYTNKVDYSVHLSTVWTNHEDVVVKFKYKLNGVEISASDLAKKTLIAISDKDKTGYKEGTIPESVTIPVNQVSPGSLYLYALDALSNDPLEPDTLVITPYFEDANIASVYKCAPLTIQLSAVDPVVDRINEKRTDNPSAMEELTASGGTESPFTLHVLDTYRNIARLGETNDGFTVTWTINDKETVITNLTADSSQNLKVLIKYDNVTSQQKIPTKVQITNTDGRRSEVLSFNVTVNPPPSVSATVGALPVGEGSYLPVEFYINDAGSIPSPLYVYLEPANAAASNLSYAAFFTTTNGVVDTEAGPVGYGVPFIGGATNTVSTELDFEGMLENANRLTFFDNLDNASLSFKYKIRLCRTPQWNPDELVSGFKEDDLTIKVANNFPVITQIRARRNNAEPGAPEKLTTSTIVMSLSDPMSTFRVSVLNDVDLDKGGVESNQVVYSWEVYKLEDGSYPAIPNMVFYTVGTNSALNMVDMFGTTLTSDYCGLYKFSVRAQDKDMRGNHPEYLYYDGAKWVYDPWRSSGIDLDGAVVPAYPEGDSLNPGNDWGAAYIFELRIDENPYVEVNPIGTFTTDDDGTPIFLESDLLNKEEMGFTVAFNDKPNISGFLGVRVAVTITPVDADGNEVDFNVHSEGVPPYVSPRVSETNFSFTASKYSSKFTFKDFDGTWWGQGFNNKNGMRYRLVAAVTSTGASPSTTPWNELYSPATNYFRLVNTLPELKIDSMYSRQEGDGDYAKTNALLNPVVPNEPFAFDWSVLDVPGDLARDYTDDEIAALGPTNLIVKCEVQREGQIYVLGAATNKNNGTFSVRFVNSGFNLLRITAYDKDDPSGIQLNRNRKYVTFFVQTSKNLFLYPYSPSRSTIDSDEVAKYHDQPGLGVGHVWADGGFASIKAYMHTWTYGTSARTARVYGEGYSAWEMDTSTSDEKSIAPKQDGSGVGEGDKRYVNQSDYDCFFYRWFKMEPGKNGSSGGSGGSGGGSSDAEWTGGAPTPGKTGDTSLTLPMQETSYTYPDSSALAVFSREKYVADNMGDINGDGIPDAFAATYWTTDSGESKRLYEIVNGGESGGEDSSVNDLADISDYNDDGDFLPVVFNMGGNPLKPTVFDWGPGVKFDALKEIRGAHMGLNEPGFSDYDLSLAERYALLADYVVADPVNHALSGVLSDDYAAATNWATATLWTPEVWTNGAVDSVGKRLNPAKADTDGDGMDDGWEYFFWYYAKVGAVTNGVWGRLEGRRYDLALPATGTRISSAEIVKHFNPLERLEGDELVDSDFTYDFDNDGLTDLEEYALGTNPIDWDSDGDGMNDLWEVMNGLDPLSLNDDPEVLEYDSTADIHNMDRDFMARCTYNDDTFTVYTFANGEMYGLPTKTSPTFTAEPIETVTNVYELVVEDPVGVTNLYYTVAPAEYDDSADPPALTADAVAFETVTVGDTVYLKSLETIPLPVGTTNVVSAAGADAVSTLTLASLYYGADKVINSDLKTVKIWFAEKPAVIHQFDTGLLQLAADMFGYTTYTHVTNTADGTVSVSYLGERTVFPAGTLLKAVAGEPTHMTQVYTTKYEEKEDEPAVGGFTWRNPETLELVATGRALPIFNYGGDGITYVPCSTNAHHFALAPVVEDESRKLTRSAVVKVERNHKVTLIHTQVFCQYGFDPRTAWNIDENGYVDRRWHDEDSDRAQAKGEAGLATRTVPYNSRDEYLVMQYRQEMRAIKDDGTRSYTASLLHGGERYLIGKGERNIAGTVGRFRSDTTYPNFPVDFVRDLYESRQEVNPFDNATNRTIVTYWTWLEQEHHIHGADTDYDGIPDGWELYVNADPNNNEDATVVNNWSYDDDTLNVLKEYAGVDSCNAYTNRYNKANKMIYPEAETITANHPGKNSGWWNKFFPTNPYDMDTDGDGVKDDAEGKGWKGEFYVGQNLYSPQDLSFIYGCKSGEANFEKYEKDGKTICFRGGGLNPCTVDTDGDLLPDAWEFQFAGVVFKDGKPLEDEKGNAIWAPHLNGLNNGKNDLDILTMGDGGHTWGKQNACSTEGYEIRGGMDGTWGNYNDSVSDGDASMDFDHDGLANCLEYLVQSLRHLRYDDSFTPLMGIHPGTKQFLKFIPFSAWDGEAFHKRCLAAGFTGLGTWKFSELGYFTLPPHKWDPIYLNTSGQSACKNYAESEGKGYRIMLPPYAFLATGAKFRLYVNGAMRYATTDPRRWDSDEDGMDDYYELFHGLNPLLGSAGCPDGRDEYDWPNTRFDVIAYIHNGYVTSWRNHWTGWPSDRVQPAFDAIRFPWMMGTMECDADGDGLRNDEESIKVNVAKPSNTHTDPTPLWMTDSSGLASYTAQYYNPDPYIAEVPKYDPLETYPDVFGLPWEELFWYIGVRGLGVSGAMRTWMFTFEENEGYDTDHDFKRDAEELSGLPTNDVFKVEVPSDPKVFCDPDRRQAIYFPGINSALASHDGKFTRAVSSEPDLLKQFTVELWVKPEGVVSNVVLVERVCNYGASTLTYSNAILRANFRLGVNANGHAYGEYEGATANSGAVRVTAPSVLPPDTWTHLALTYSGKNSVISLYVNGEVAPVATVHGQGLIPANGVIGIQQEYYTAVIPYGYIALPCATVFGAHALNGAAIALDETTQWTDFDANSFFKGWIDEVRIWDGARTPSEIHANYRKRFTMDEIKLMRSREDDSGIQGFYEQWFDWRTTQNCDPIQRASLPAELLQHYSFTTLPGGIGPTNVLTEVVEFKKNVLDNVRKPNGETLRTFLKPGWWSKTPVRSKIYSNYVIPWIGNTVAHLPFLDGSSPDSQYWSEKVAGVMKAEDQGFTSYDYPNEANPYPYYLYRRDRFNRRLLLDAIDNTDTENVTNVTGVTSSTLAWKWRFQLRSDFLGTSDLVPLGGAYARRDTDFWDGQGAMDAWTETSKAGESADVNGNGIPDWAEALGLTTADDYLRALAEGLLPDGSKNPDYADLTDLKRDGVRDWWQKMYGLTGSAHNDTDADGLADFAEYLVSEVFKFGEISPLLAKSNTTEFDYFRKVGRLYLGELFSDHDHMEDGYEREWAEIGADPAYYDAHLDSDEDGWSNWAEVRAKSDMGLGIAELDTSVTNVFYYTIPREDYAGYACYGDFKAMSDALNDLQTKGELIVEDAQFTTVGFGHTYVQDSVRNLPGCPSGKNGEYHTDRYGTGWFRIRFISTPYGRTWRYRGHPTPDVSMTIHYNGIEDIVGRSLQVSAYTDGELKDADATFTVVNTRAAKVGENRNVNTLSFLVPDTGYLREGMNTFVVTVAASNSTESASAATKPAIIGVARDVNVGWSKVEFDVELLDESPICPRPELTYSLEGENKESSSSSNEGSAATGSGTSHVYVYRYAVDEYMPPSALENRLILDKDIGYRTYLHEGDFLADGAYDIDWAYFQSEVVGNPAVARNGFPVTSVTYRVYSQLVNISAEASSNSTPYVEFTREFGKARATAVPVAPGDYASIFYSARPTFVWRMTGDRPDTYTAFAIQVLDAGGTTPIWNSGTQIAPPRNINGDYEWQAPLYPGDQTGLGKVFANTNNYTWRVTMFNAKFQSSVWSEKRNFRMNVYAEDEVNIADTYSIRVAVKYFGPGSFNTAAATVAGTLRVEAFTSPDFSGEPAGRTFVRDLASVTDADHAVNAKIIGLKSGTYYVRAYIDSDGDFKRDDWESWGYASPRGDVVSGAIFAPSAVTIGEGVEPPSVLVYVEDCDTDQDCLPDVWEYNEANGASGFLTKKGPMSDAYNGYISVNPNLSAAITDLINGGNSISLLSAGPTRMPKTLAALMLGADSVEPSIDAKTLSIKSLALADGNVTISLAAEAEDPAAGTVFVTDGMVRVTVVVKYADSLSGEWNSVEKSIEKKIEDGAVSEELTFSLEELGLDASKGFFKVEVKQ